MLTIAACGKKDNQGSSEEMQDEINNPYFNPEIENVEYSYCEELLFEGKIKWDIELLESNKYGSLYKTEYNQTEEGIINYYSDSDKDFFTEMIHGGWEWFFWVTDDCIYYINYISDDERDLLTDSGKLPENALPVCQEEVFNDELSQEEKGDHKWIEKHDGDIICYRSFSVNYMEPRDILQFVWKKDVGLIGFRYAGSPAGGDSIIIWNPEYLQRRETGFDIDREE